LLRSNGAVTGQVTSAAWGETTGSCVGLAYLRSADQAVLTAGWISEGAYQINVGGRLHPISVSLRALYDPTNERIRP
jgi:glycine cleavage system aminomethyltransferase T